MMETIDIKRFQNRTKDSNRLLAFFEPKKGRGQELEKILLERKAYSERAGKYIVCSTQIN
jgi:hypothetical protein